MGFFLALCMGWDAEASVNSSVDCEFGVQRLRLFVTCQDGNARE